MSTMFTRCKLIDLAPLLAQVEGDHRLDYPESVRWAKYQATERAFEAIEVAEANNRLYAHELERVKCAIADGVSDGDFDERIAAALLAGDHAGAGRILEEAVNKSLADLAECIELMKAERAAEGRA